MRKLLLAVAVLTVGFALPAAADNCQVFTNHSGHVPGSYDYAVFHEDDPAVDLTVETDGEDIFVDPQQYGAGNSWDMVANARHHHHNHIDHDGTTTTTTVGSTTTSTAPTTTTTTPATTTTAPPGSTTVPATWKPCGPRHSDCSVLGAEWGEGIVQVDVWQRLPEGDFHVDSLA